MNIKNIAALVLIGFIYIGSVACIAEADLKENISKNDNEVMIFESEDGSVDESMNATRNQAYQYQENDGIFVFYETEDEDLYRKLLPDAFDMPNEMIVHLFIMDFYDIDSEAAPYKEMSISLLAKHDGQDVWHCIYMPVTSEQSMIAGRVGLGLPKTIGDITFTRDDFAFTGSVIDEDGRSGTIVIDTEDYQLTEVLEDTIRDFMDIPKINLLNGEYVQMTRAGGAVNIVDVANRFSRFVTLQGGLASISFDTSEDNSLHPFDLAPTNVIAAYYLHNEIPFSLTRKQ